LQFLVANQLYVSILFQNVFISLFLSSRLIIPYSSFPLFIKLSRTEIINIYFLVLFFTFFLLLFILLYFFYLSNIVLLLLLSALDFICSGFYFLFHYYIISFINIIYFFYAFYTEAFCGVLTPLRVAFILKSSICLVFFNDSFYII
jgi:hypothetical protein